MSDATCVRCGGAVPSGAQSCQHCGYDATSHSKYRWFWGLLGLLFMLSIIGIPLGVPMLWKAYKHRKAYERGVAR
jgi:predicted nucleic acid-binding Zn ribbon protein